MRSLTIQQARKRRITASYVGTKYCVTVNSTSTVGGSTRDFGWRGQAPVLTTRRLSLWRRTGIGTPGRIVAQVREFEERFDKLLAWDADDLKKRTSGVELIREVDRAITDILSTPESNQRKNKRNLDALNDVKISIGVRVFGIPATQLRGVSASG